MKKTHLSHSQVVSLVHRLRGEITVALGQSGKESYLAPVKVWGVPRGGTCVAYLLTAYSNFQVVDTPQEADIVVDDIVDSGKTRTHYVTTYGKPFFAIVDKFDKTTIYDGWVVFPWETNDKQETAETVEENVVRILQFIGEDTKRGGLLETPKRVTKAWQEWTSGYSVDIAGLFKTFEDGAESCDEMVTRLSIPFYSHCEHHMAAVFGVAHVAYIPDGKVVGLSKLDRVVDAFARRLQVQERMTNQIADAIMEHLSPRGVGVQIVARHLCVESRGVRHADSTTVTTALRGVFKDGAVKQEFLTLIPK